MKIGYLMQAGAANMLVQPLSGPCNHVKHVCQELEALGHQVQILMNLDGQLWHSTDLEHYRPVNITHMERGVLKLLQRMVRRTQSTLQLPYAALFDALWFAQACSQLLGDCDLFYERMGWMGYGGALAARRLKIPLVIEVNGDHLDEMQMLGVEPHGGQKWLSMHLMRWMTGQSAHVVTTGDGWRKRFVERWPVAPEAVSAIENGSELVTLLKREALRAFTDNTVNHTVNHTVNPINRDIRLVYVGGFETWHGISVLLRALARARQQGAPVSLYLIGAGPEQRNIEQQIEALQLQQVVTLTGFVDIHQLADYLAQADVGLCPYCGRVEYSGLKLLDYKAAGLATIASGANGQPIVVRHGVTGLIVPPCDEEALCQAIVQLSADHALRRQMGQTARSEAEEQHSWRHTAQRLDTIFQQVVNKRPVYYANGKQAPTAIGR
jgi:glycosyltransferase involved in cell wall biosynthesis